MNPIKTYEYLTTARRRLLDWVRPLGAEGYAQEFPIGLGTLGRTLTHTLAAEWAYARRIGGVGVPARGQWPFQYENPPEFAALEAAWTEQAGRTMETIRGVGDWNAEFEYSVDWDGPTIITVSASDVFTQLVLHEVHHRAQAMSMLRQLGVPAQDLDFNALMYKRRPAPFPS